jgi:hypothetical protein
MRVPINAGPVAVTVTPGNTAFVVSVTTPTMEPLAVVTVWPDAIAPVLRTRIETAMATLFFIMHPNGSRK